jgi:hypothetical protein
VGSGEGLKVGVCVGVNEGSGEGGKDGVRVLSTVGFGVTTSQVKEICTTEADDNGADGDDGDDKVSSSKVEKVVFDVVKKSV